MPLPIPRKRESEDDFIGRCVPLVLDLEGLDKDDDKERKQAIAICYSQWRKAKGGKAMEIHDLMGLSFDVDGEGVSFEELVEAYKAQIGDEIKAKEEKEEWHLTKADIKELIGIIDAELARRKKEKDEGKSTLANMAIEELEDSLFNACPARGGLGKAGWMTKVRSWVKSAGTKSLTGYRRRLVMIGTKMGMSFKSVLAEEGKALSLDEQARQVRDAWRSEFVKPGVPGEVSGSYWPKEVFEDQVIVETPQGLYAYPYTVGEDGEVEFGEPVKVEVQYRPVGTEKAWRFDGSADEEAMIAFGGEVKALGEGRIGGHLVRFGSEAEKDLTGQWFTPNTYYGPEDGDGADAMIHHGIPMPADTADPRMKTQLAQLSRRFLAPLKVKRDAIGLWAETVCNLADEYERMVHDMVEMGKMKWSSGSTRRQIRVEPTGEIKRWYITEGSLTPIPAEFRGTQVMPLKSYLEAIGLGLSGAQTGGATAGAVGLEAAKIRARAQLALIEIEQEI